MSGLEVRNMGYSVNPWRVLIVDGPRAGTQLGSFRLKREASAYLDEVDGPLWGECVNLVEFMSTIPDGALTPSCVVTTVHDVRTLGQHLAYLERELTVCRRYVVSQKGSYMAVERIRRELNIPRLQGPPRPGLAS